MKFLRDIIEEKRMARVAEQEALPDDMNDTSDAAEVARIDVPPAPQDDAVSASADTMDFEIKELEQTRNYDDDEGWVGDVAAPVAGDTSGLQELFAEDNETTPSAPLDLQAFEIKSSLLGEQNAAEPDMRTAPADATTSPDAVESAVSDLETLEFAAEQKGMDLSSEIDAADQHDQQLTEPVMVEDQDTTETPEETADAKAFQEALAQDDDIDVDAAADKPDFEDQPSSELDTAAAPFEGQVDASQTLQAEENEIASEDPDLQDVVSAIPMAVPAPAIGRAAGRSGRVKTRILGFSAPAATQDPFEKAVASQTKQKAAQFPVGWLVVTDGPGRGAAFTLFDGVSQIGRGEDQTVRLDFGDNSISRENHAAIAYDCEQQTFFVGHGGKANLVRVNERPVLSTEELHSDDTVRIGETTLRFVGFCGQNFSWEQESEAPNAAVQ